ncbi:DUF1206 domain-containing protein [Peribacillus deserti]|uniref:DUF1206 domain-containing protein n=1 Tax=Peribacillus deserti TaxID=673318 RepID=A0A2N5MAP7_9BACI|nr:DUF1206 domain-containing protein [Peribacillus deserti]PLT31424.1 hypothetical protein CUU66_02885 [Peribacillus deserti]
MLNVEAEKNVKAQAKKTSHELKPWIKKFARAGFMAKGTVYFLAGVLSLFAACGMGGDAKGTSGVLGSVVSRPYGEVIVWIIAMGLAGYVMWLFFQVINKQSKPKHGLKDILRRIGYAISCGIYAGLAVKAFSLAVHAGTKGNAKQTWTEKLLTVDAGQWIIGIIGIGIIGFGISEIYSGWSKRFLKQFDTAGMNPKEIEVTKKSGRVGLISKGIVFCFLGYFVVKMAVTVNPNNPKGLDGALEKMLHQPYGPWILGIISIGLAIYGIYEIMKGKNKHIVI